MRRFMIDPTRPSGSRSSSRTSADPRRGRWLPWLIVLAGLSAPSGLQAQSAKESTATVSQTVTGDSTVLSRYIPKENLIFYFEFAGLDAHSATWSRTAAYRLLTETPLGSMLESVVGQLLDKALSGVPRNKLTGPECVTLIKHLARHGLAGGVRVITKAGDTAAPPDFHGTFVFRGASTKEMRSISSRAMSWLMRGDAKVRIERKEGRPMVAVPYPVPGAEGKEETWTWWPEKDLDLVISTSFPKGVESVLASLDGKIPSASEHPIVKSMWQPEADFDAVCVAFLDTANCPKTSDKLTEQIHKISEAGIHRIDYRWGFDDDALKTIARLIAPKPRKPMLALFEQPGFAKTALLPMPDGVESFLEFSVNLSHLIDTIGEFGPEVKDRIEEFADKVQKSGRIDLRKELLDRMGPRIVLYVAPGRSATTGNETFETSWLQGFNPARALATMPTLPKITLVTEVDDPIKFGKALDGAIIAMNSELKAQASMKADEEPEKEDQGGVANAGRGPGGRAGGGAQAKRSPRRRSADAVSAPKFEAMASEMKADAPPSNVKAYLLRTPTDSALRLGPPGFRPVIRLDGKYLAISIVADGAEAALKAVKQKDWKPSDDVQRACDRLPPKIVMLSMIDPREILPSVLASYPATLQTMINSAVLVRNQMMAGGMNGRGGNPGNGPGAMAGRGGPGGGRMGRRPGGPGMNAPGGGEGGAPGPGSNNPTGTPSDGTIELKVEADKLPQAEAIRSRLFLTTVSLDVSDQEIRFVMRKAFPNLFNWSIFGLSATLGAQQAQADMAAKASQAAAAAGGPGANPGAEGGPGGAVAPPGGRGGPGGRGNGRPGGRRGRGGAGED